MLKGDKIWAETWMESNWNVYLMLVKIHINTTLWHKRWEVEDTHALWLRNSLFRYNSTEMLASLWQELCTGTACLLIYLVMMFTFVLASLELNTEGLPLGSVVQHFWLLLTYWKIYCSKHPQCFTVSNCEQLKCPSTLECIYKLCYFIWWNTLQQWEWMNYIYILIIDASHSDKWRKPDTEEHMVCNSVYIKFEKEAKLYPRV